MLQRLHSLRLSFNHISSLKIFAEADVAQGLYSCRKRMGLN